MEGEAQVTGLSTVASCLAPGACARDGGQGALRIRKQCGALMRGQADGSSSPPAMRGLTLFLIVEGGRGGGPYFFWNLVGFRDLCSPGSRV